MANKEVELANFLARCRAANQKQDQKQAQPDLHAGAPKEAKGPSRTSLKSCWRDDAAFLEQEFPEEFGPSPKAHSPEVPAEVMSTGLRASLPPSVITPGPSQSALESAQSVPEVLPAPPPIPPLPASWWQGLLYGSPDAMLSAADATSAMHLIAQALGVNSGPSEFSEGVRGAALRKLLEAHFGAAQAWRAMNELWRSASPSPGAPSPNQDQSQMTPGSWPVSREQPRWVREFHDPGGVERDWMIENGLWCG
jgi:hypothetical protein